MITFIKNKEELENLSKRELIVIPIIDEKVHFSYENITLIYLIDIKSNEEFVINLTHPDYKTFDGNYIHISAELLLTTNKKTLLYKDIIDQNSIDINFIFYPHNHKHFDLSNYIPKSYFIFQSRFVDWKIYPLSIIIQICRDVGKDMLALYLHNQQYISDVKKIDNLYYNTLFKTELNPFEFQYDIVYSNYNPYTLTNRPTNSSFGVNFSALSKKNDVRTKLKSLKQDYNLAQFDYSSFHVFLLARMLNFDLPKNTDIYLYLNEKYKFSDKEIRNDIKADFFKYIYGTKEYSSELSDIINKFKLDLFNEFQANGYIYSFLLKRKIFFNQADITQSNKLFNYYIQNVETEFNLLKLTELLDNLKNDNCSILLYTYDSFLFEYDKNDTNLIDKIQGILQKDGIPVTVQIGTNYGNLNDIY